MEQLSNFISEYYEAFQTDISKLPVRMQITFYLYSMNIPDEISLVGTNRLSK